MKMATAATQNCFQSDVRSAFHVLKRKSVYQAPSSASKFLLCSSPSSATSNFKSIVSTTISTTCRLIYSLSFSSSPPSSLRFRAFSTASPDPAVKLPQKPSVCTADELHYVSLANSDWRLALWRYHPSPQGPKRNHPLLLLSGVGTNAVGYDLSPGSSFARYMSDQGFDTWILEVRGAGLSVRSPNVEGIQQSADNASNQMEAASEKINLEGMSSSAIFAGAQMSSVNGTVSYHDGATLKGQGPTVESAKEDITGLATVWDESKVVTTLTENFMRLSERLSGFLSESQSKIMSAKFFDQISKLLVDSQLIESFNEIRENLSSLLEARQSSAIASQIKDLSQRLVNIIDEGQRSVSPPLFDIQERFNMTVEDFQKQLELIAHYDWDFDHYLEEDVPAAMEYIRGEIKPKDGKLLAIGHSMGGILLYAMLSKYSCDGRDPRLAAVVTLASSLDYTSSKSTLKMLLPLADPAQALNVPVVPLGTLLSVAYPFSSRPPYVLSWLNQLISAENMMEPELLKKLVLNNFCTIPAKLLLQLTTAFKEGGLCDRSGKFFYKDYLRRTSVPVLALAGDRDLICPPDAVEETVKLFPQHLVTYKLFGEADGPHYAHYDLVGGRLAVEQVYPCIVEFLSRHD